MTRIRGQFFDGHSSVRHPVELEIGADGRLRLTGLGEVREYRLSETEVSERIGHTPRTLRFADGSACQVLDNDAIDAVLEYFDTTSARHDVHRLESQWTYAVLALVALVAIVWVGIEYGIPAAARHATRIFHSGYAFHSTAHVDSERPHTVDRLDHTCGMQTPGQDHFRALRQQRGALPVGVHALTADRTFEQHSRWKIRRVGLVGSQHR